MRASGESEAREGDAVEFHAGFDCVDRAGFAYIEGATTLAIPERTDASPCDRIVLCTTCRYSAAEKTGPDGRTGGETLIGHMRDVLRDEGTR